MYPVSIVRPSNKMTITLEKVANHTMAKQVLG